MKNISGSSPRTNTDSHLNDDRRRFIKAAASTVASVPLIGHAAAASDAANRPYDTIVIGGGFAGVTAARETSQRGLKTLLLEARPRLGGRTLTLDLGGHDLDVGGTWVGWSQPHVWAEVMRYGLPIDESAAAAADRAVWMSNGQRKEGPYTEYAKLFQTATDAFYAPARQAFPRPFDPLFVSGSEKLDAISAAQAVAQLELHPTERDLALSLAAINGHARAQDSSYLDQMRWIALGDFDVWNMFDNLARYRIRGGTKRLLNRIHKDSRAETRLNTPIRSVRQSQGQVVVTSTTGDTYQARRLIVAVPLNCLADIEFEPALNARKLRVSGERHTGSGTKLYAQIKGKKPLFVGHGTEAMPLCFLWTEYDDADSQILVGFGTSYDLLDVNSEEAVVNAVRDYLPDAEVTDFYTYNWNIDPYAKGTWCMYRPNVLTQDFEALQQSESLIHFAGADIANGWRGFIDGAIESGLTSARAVADAIQTDA